MCISRPHIPHTHISHMYTRVVAYALVITHVRAMKYEFAFMLVKCYDVYL